MPQIGTFVTHFAHVSFVDFDLEIARLHARPGADLAANGTSVGAHDLIIASLRSGSTVASPRAIGNRRSYPKTPGLDVI